MIKILKINLKSFSKEKTFKNFVIILFFMIFSIFVILLYNKRINDNYTKLINDESNRIIYIEDMSHYKFVNQFINENKNNFEELVYSSYITNFEFSNNIYDVICIDEFSENDYEIKSNIDDMYIKLFDLKAKNYYDKTLINTIVINRKISKYLFENKFDLLTSYSIEIKVDNYYKYIDYVNFLFDNNIEYRENVNINENINIIENNRKIVEIFMLIFAVIFIIVDLFLVKSVLNYDKKNIVIYRITGLSIFKIVLIYFCTYLLHILIISFLFLLLCFIIKIHFEFMLSILIVILISLVSFFCLFKKEHIMKLR